MTTYRIVQERSIELEKRAEIKRKDLCAARNVFSGQNDQGKSEIKRKDLCAARKGFSGQNDQIKAEIKRKDLCAARKGFSGQNDQGKGIGIFKNALILLINLYSGIEGLPESTYRIFEERRIELEKSAERKRKELSGIGIFKNALILLIDLYSFIEGLPQSNRIILQERCIEPHKSAERKRKELSAARKGFSGQNDRVKAARKAFLGQNDRGKAARKGFSGQNDRGKANSKPIYNGGVVIGDRLLVINDDENNIQIYNRHDGKLKRNSKRLEHRPMDICILNKADNATNVAVCFKYGIIKIISLQETDEIQEVKSFETGLSRCYSVAKWKSKSIMFSGRKDNKLVWGVHDEMLNPLYNICTSNRYHKTHMAIIYNTIYISCNTDDPNHNGVNAYDMFNPDEPRFVYRHQELKSPGSIVADGDYLYVCDRNSNKIQQLTESGELVTIHIVQICPNEIFYDKQHGEIYSTSRDNSVVTVYKIEYLHHEGVPLEILEMPEKDAVQLYKEALKEGEKTVHKIYLTIIGDMGAGKSTLVKRILGEEVDISQRISTKCIHVHADCCNVSLSTGIWKKRTIGSLYPLKHNIEQDHSSTATEGESKLGLVQKQFTPSKANRINMINSKEEVIDETEGTDRNSLLTILDFPGQQAIYAKCQTVLKRKSIYMLVFDASNLISIESHSDGTGKQMDKIKGQVEMWLNTVHSYASSPESEVLPLILVATHVENLSQSSIREICDRYASEIRSYLKHTYTKLFLIDEVFVIDNTIDIKLDIKLEYLRKEIVKVASQQPYCVEKIPTQWTTMEQELMRRKASGKKMISLNDVKQLRDDIRANIQDLGLFLNFLHSTGKIIYDKIAKEGQYIVLDPTGMIETLNSLINQMHDLPKGNTFLSTELTDVISDQYDHKNEVLKRMVGSNIIITVKRRWVSEIGEKTEECYLAPSILRQEYPSEIVNPVQDPKIVSTPFLCCDFTGKYLPITIVDRLIAACVSRWPVAKKEETDLIFRGCCIFDLNLFHRLILHYEKNIVFSRITWNVQENDIDVRLCTGVRKFIALNLSKIISDLGLNLEYELFSWWTTSQAFAKTETSAPCDMWCADVYDDPDAHLSTEHMNFARLCIVLATVCTQAMRDILRTHVPSPHSDIYEAIQAKKIDLINTKIKTPLLNHDQQMRVFSPPKQNHEQTEKTGKLEDFDISLLYILIKEVSSVGKPKQGWENDPKDHQEDRSLAASVYRMYSYRKRIIYHSANGKIEEINFEKYWKELEAVLTDIGKDPRIKIDYKKQLAEQKKHVISIFEAC